MIEVGHTQILPGQTLDPRHLVHYVQKHTMQLLIHAIVFLDQLDKAGESALKLHHLESVFIRPTVVEENRGEEVYTRCLVFLIHH